MKRHSKTDLYERLSFTLLILYAASRSRERKKKHHFTEKKKKVTRLTEALVLSASDPSLSEKLFGPGGREIKGHRLSLVRCGADGAGVHGDPAGEGGGLVGQPQDRTRTPLLGWGRWAEEGWYPSGGMNAWMTGCALPSELRSPLPQGTLQGMPPFTEALLPRAPKKQESMFLPRCGIWC